MSVSTRPGRDREMAAVTFNQKEQRCLERAMKTLHLEYCYQLKLLDLDRRVIRVNHKRLKDKVTRIKSYLTAEEIQRLRKLENDGKLKSNSSSLNLNNTLKIAAATKRLKCFPPAQELERVDNSRSVRQSYPLTSTPVANYTKRSNSMANFFSESSTKFRLEGREPSNISDSIQGLSKRSSGLTSEYDRVQASTDLSIKPRKGVYDNHIRLCNTGRQYTYTPDSECTKPVVLRPATSDNVHVAQHSHSPFSSHSSAEKDAAKIISDSFRPQRELKMYISDESIDSNLGDDLYEERRQELLEDELTKAAELEFRKKEFLKRVDSYLSESRSKLLPNNIFLKQKPKQTDGSENVVLPSPNDRLNSRRLRVDFDQKPTYLPEEEYRKRLLNLWTDMNKCRYLRVPDDLLDLSGIRTLATEQIKLFDSIRNVRDKTFAASAEV